MWRFQGACDADAIIYEKEKRIKEQNREIKKMCEELRTKEKYQELQRRKERGEIQEYEIEWDDFARTSSRTNRSHSRNLDSNPSEGKVRFIRKILSK